MIVEKAEEATLLK